MTREKMTELLSETIHVTLDDAKAALEASEWNVLGAADLLQLNRRKQAAEVARLPRRKVGSAFSGLIARFRRDPIASAN